jgi:hypothetical protein
MLLMQILFACVLVVMALAPLMVEGAERSVVRKGSGR